MDTVFVLDTRGRMTLRFEDIAIDGRIDVEGIRENLLYERGGRLDKEPRKCFILENADRGSN